VTYSHDNAEKLLSQPYSPGTSPFQIKGNAYQGHLDYTKDEIPGGVEKMMTLLPSDALREFFGQRFLTSSFYDVFPLAIAGVACGKMAGTSFLDFVRRRASWQAEADLNGVYKALLHFASARLVIGRLPQMAKMIFNFGQVSCEVNEKGRSVMAWSGLPEPLGPWYGAVTEGYTEAVIGRTNTPGLVIRHLGMLPDGRRQNTDLVKLRYEFTWTDSREHRRAS